MDMRLREFREGVGSTEEIPGMETSPAAAADAIAPVLIRNIVAGMIVSADNSLLHLAEKYNLHQIYRLLRTFQKLLISSFLFFLGVLPSVLSFLSLLFHTYAFNFTSPKSDDYAPPSSSSAAADAGVARALAQLLVILNDIPVSSRKYELVRSLAELLIDENHRQGFESLRELNRHVLSAAFARALGRLESSASEIDPSGRFSRCGSGTGLADFGLGRVFRVVRGAGEVCWARFMSRAGGRCEYSAEKMAAELLWLAQKMASCGIAEEAVCRWASASNVASLGLSAEPRLQGSLIKISAFLIKQAKAMEAEPEAGEGKNPGIRQTRMNMLMTWLPLLCRASNGTDAPVLSGSERAELERALEETIAMLAQEEQEKVLSLWLHHFTHCSNSDWPNLQSAFLHWCNTSRKVYAFK